MKRMCLRNSKAKVMRYSCHFTGQDKGGRTDGRRCRCLCSRVTCSAALIPTREIDAIRLITKSSLLTEPYAGLVRGQRVMMIAGPLSGLTGTLIEIRKRPRLVISVELLHRSVLVEVERDWAVPCEPAKVMQNAGALRTKSLQALASGQARAEVIL